MSNSLAIAAVTSTLRYVLERALDATHPGPVGGATVTTLRPNQLSDTALVSAPGINIYLLRRAPPTTPGTSPTCPPGAATAASPAGRSPRSTCTT